MVFSVSETIVKNKKKSLDTTKPRSRMPLASPNDPRTLEAGEDGVLGEVVENQKNKCQTMTSITMQAEAEVRFTGFFVFFFPSREESE